VQDLDRHRAPELLVVGLPHLARPAAAQARLQVVRAETCAGDSGMEAVSIASDGGRP
jgi:hypothetical protein